jgi:hypothetical protein
MTIKRHLIKMGKKNNPCVHRPTLHNRIKRIIYDIYYGLFVVLSTHPLLVPKLRIGQSYTSASSIRPHSHVMGVTFTYYNLPT